MKTLYLVRGVPGSGKSTFAQAMVAARMAHCCIEADMWFMVDGQYRFDPTQLRQAHEWCQNQVKENLDIGFSVVVSNTSTTEKEVQTYQKIAEEYGAKFVSVVVENRHGCDNIHNVPAEKVQQMKDRFSLKL